jgi:hypothetical protein
MKLFDVYETTVRDSECLTDMLNIASEIDHDLDKNKKNFQFHNLISLIIKSYKIVKRSATVNYNN